MIDFCHKPQVQCPGPGMAEDRRSCPPKVILGAGKDPDISYRGGSNHRFQSPWQHTGTVKGRGFIQISDRNTNMGMIKIEA